MSEAALEAHAATVDEYIDHFGGRKTEAYRAIYDRYKNEGKRIKLKLRPMLKKNEALFGPEDSVRSRVIWNPDPELKVFLGTLNYNILKLLKSTDKGYASGLTPEELESRIQEAFRTIADPYLISTDGSAHDSSQRDWWIRTVDNAIFKKLGVFLCLQAGMSAGEAEATYAAAVSTEMAFIMDYAGTRNPMITGKVKATVYSGHPSRTTFGNSVRVMALFRAV